jgi:hypothetical protein
MRVSNPFLSDEDLDLASLSWEELREVWAQWLLAAQVSNHLDEDSYSHGVFQLVKEPRKHAAGDPSKRKIALRGEVAPEEP